MNAFLSKENVEMIWEIIDDEEISRINNSQTNEVQQFFIEEIRSFYQRERNSNKSLINMNKEFISNIIELLKNKPPAEQPEKTLQTQQQPQPPQITSEDIQTHRMNEFEKMFITKQNEFNNAMSIQIPKKPEFTNEMDIPMINMEELISKTIAQRNLEIDQIQQTINQQTGDNEKRERIKMFLTSQDTSLKNEKNAARTDMQQLLNQKPEINQSQYNVSMNEVKYIKIGKEDIPHISEIETIESMNGISYTPNNIQTNEKKHITWADESNKRSDAPTNFNTSNIFSRLKIKPQESSYQDIFTQTEESGIELQKIENYTAKFTKEIELIHSKIDDINRKIEEIMKKHIHDKSENNNNENTSIENTGEPSIENNS